jgi:hypothetical protein
MIIDIEITEITPNDPNQSSETYSTKSSLAGKSNPVIIPNTIRDSKIPLNLISYEKYFHSIIYYSLLLTKMKIFN